MISALQRDVIRLRYHNALHGADVTQTLHYFIQSGGVGSYLTQEMLFTCIVAALIHDCGHPGVNNAFLVKTDDPLAITYNDKSPLENMHCATAFGIMQDRRSNILGGIPRSSHDTVREAIISMVRETFLMWLVIEKRMAEVVCLYIYIAQDYTS